MLIFIYTEPIKRPSRTEDFSQITSKSSQAVPLADIPPRSLSHISETSRDEQSWAITQQYQSTHGARTPSAVSIKIFSSSSTRRHSIAISQSYLRDI